VNDPKTRHSTRKIALDTTLLRELKHWKLACPPTAERLVFPSPSGGYVDAPGMVRKLRALIGRCGFERPEVAAFRWHDLRHTFASHSLAQGDALIDVSRGLGHSSPTVTATVYAHALADRETERRDRLGRLFAEKVKHN
jgi:integrase